MTISAGECIIHEDISSIFIRGNYECAWDAKDSPKSQCVMRFHDLITDD